MQLQNIKHRRPDLPHAVQHGPSLLPRRRVCLPPALRQALLLAALSTLLIGSVYLDELAREEAIKINSSGNTIFSICEQPRTQWGFPTALQVPKDSTHALSAGLGSTCRDDGVPIPEPWLFLRLTGPDSRLHRFIRVHATGYTSCPSETDCTPNITAANTLTAHGTIALSRDLIRTYTPGAPFDFGDKVLIPGVGVFEVWDTMNARWRERADIWFELKEDAREWGLREVFLTLVTEDAPTMAYSPQ